MRNRRVAVLVETSVVYGREVLLGIADYARGASGAKWSIFAEQHELGALPPPWLLRQRWAGIISRPTNARLARALRYMRVPVVDLNDMHQDLGFPRLQSDNPAIGRLAADHLRDRGFRHFAYCGFSGEPWAADRRDGFARRLAALGFAGVVFETYWRGRRVLSWAAEQRQLGQWLSRLPKPVAVFACNDVRGRHVLEACRRLGLAVPDHVAVLGVDNDELFCRMSDPPLSSVVPDAHRVGFEAAAMLDRLMSGQRPSPSRQTAKLIAPRSVVNRQSTDVLAVEDERVALALRYIRASACEGIGVTDVLRVVPVSRSILDRRFKATIGRSPHSEIRAVQLGQAARLLEETDLPLKQVAAQCGIPHTEYLSYLFQRAHGMPPGAYRRARARQQQQHMGQ
jgi:LacI family transcriptional regulator